MNNVTTKGESVVKEFFNNREYITKTHDLPEDWTYLTEYIYDIEEFISETGIKEEIVEDIVFLDVFGWCIKSDSYLNNYTLGYSIDKVKDHLKGEPMSGGFFEETPKTESDRLNQLWKKYEERNKKLEEDKDYVSLSYNIDKNRRLWWLYTRWDEIDEESRMSIFSDAYISMEFPRTNIGYGYIMEMLVLMKNPHLLMNKEEKEFYDNLPDKVKVYRGINLSDEDELDERLEHYGLGISWTLDEEKGKWFRNRFFRKQRYLFEGLVDKKDIIVYLKSRGEEEVIINPINIKDIKKIG